jgi:hypothetical protein
MMLSLIRRRALGGKEDLERLLDAARVRPRAKLARRVDLRAAALIALQSAPVENIRRISTRATPCGGFVASRNACRKSASIVDQSRTRLVSFAKERHTSRCSPCFSSYLAWSVVPGQASQRERYFFI